MSGKSKYGSMEARLLANSILELATDCWTWIGPRDKRHSTPYGKINVWRDGRTVTLQAHRVSYETFSGPIPAGFEIDHMCKNTHCINPAHLEAVSPATNKERRTRVYRKHTARTMTVTYERV